MSYSRWGGSRWYTFWAGRDDATENRESALFEICSITTFTAAEIRADIQRCLTIAVKKEQQRHQLAGVDHDEREELREYMREFLAAVDREYPEGVK